MSRVPNTIKFAIVFSVISLHTLRNASLAGYMAGYALALAWSGLAFLRSGWRERLADRGASIVVWVALALGAGVMTVAISSPSAAVNGLSRFLFCLPVFLALVAWTDSRRQLMVHLGVMLGWFALLSLTLPLQFLTGPIPIFAAPSSRGGEIRYASAVGSLTAIGIIVGCYLILSQVLRPRWRWTILLLTTLPAMASLSKAAIANVAAAWLVVLWLNRRNRAMLAAAGIGLPLGAGLAYAAVPAIKDRVDASLLSFGLKTDKAAFIDDVSLSTSIVERLTQLPAQNWEGLEKLHNPLVYWLGGGYGMGDTALVGEGQGITIMAHNQVFECMSVFGIPAALVQWGILTLALVLLFRHAKRTGDPLYEAAAWALVMLTVNSWLANGTLYQPMAGSMMFLLLFLALSAPVLRDSLSAPTVRGVRHGTEEPAA